jgi:multidrug efflux pump subunit AcrA (membrane-fusion protein)
MKPIVLVLMVMLSGCAGQAVSQATPSASPQPVQVQTVDLERPQRRRLVLKLTVASPGDLVVREGDRVVEGQVLADRARERARLEGQLERLGLQLERLQQPIPGPPSVREVPQLAGLPPAHFLSEVAETERMRLKVEAAERNLQQQQRMVDMLDALPDAEVPEAVLPHEREMLAQRQRELDQAKAELVLAQGKLSQAQNERQFQEYQHSITVANRQLQIEQNQLERQAQLQRQQQAERDRSFQVAQLEAQRSQVEMQLVSLSVVRAPWAGQIQRIRWEEQRDQALVVQLTLVADGGRDGGAGAGDGTDGDGADGDGRANPGADPAD